MADPVTPNKGYTVPATGADVNTWGPIVNGNFTTLDALQGSTYSLVVSSGGYTLTSSNALNLRVQMTGTLAGAVTLTVPQKPGYWYFHDQTTRAGFSITVTTGASNGRTQNLPARLSHLFTDGQNCWLVTEPNHGETKPFAGLTAPPLWQLCYGQTISRTTYADLFAAIGTTYGAGDGSTTFGLPDYRGRALLGQDDMGGSAAGRITSASGFGPGIYKTGGNQLLQAHTHNISDPGHTHAINDPGHTHNQTTHSHGVSDPGHAHGVSDPGHSHTWTTPIYNGLRYTSGSQVGGYSGPGTTVNNTSGSTTGIGISAATTGVSVDGAFANLVAATTGVTNSSATTGISTQTSGSGASQNMPPAATVPMIIYCGQ